MVFYVYACIHVLRFYEVVVELVLLLIILWLISLLCVSYTGNSLRVMIIASLIITVVGIPDKTLKSVQCKRKCDRPTPGSPCILHTPGSPSTAVWRLQ